MWLVHWGTEEWWISRCASVGHLGSVTRRPPPVFGSEKNGGKTRRAAKWACCLGRSWGLTLRFNLEKEQFTLWSAALSTVAAPAASLCGSEVMCFIQELWVSLFQRNIDRYLTSTYISSASCRALWQIGLQANWITRCQVRFWPTCSIQQNFFQLPVPLFNQHIFLPNPAQHIDFYTQASAG